MAPIHKVTNGGSGRLLVSIKLAELQRKSEELQAHIAKVLAHNEAACAKILQNKRSQEEQLPCISVNVNAITAQSQGTAANTGDRRRPQNSYAAQGHGPQQVESRQANHESQSRQSNRQSGLQPDHKPLKSGIRPQRKPPKGVKKQPPVERKQHLKSGVKPLKGRKSRPPDVTQPPSVQPSNEVQGQPQNVANKSIQPDERQPPVAVQSKPPDNGGKRQPPKVVQSAKRQPLNKSQPLNACVKPLSQAPVAQAPNLPPDPDPDPPLDPAPDPVPEPDPSQLPETSSCLKKAKSLSAKCCKSQVRFLELGQCKNLNKVL